MKYEGFSKNRLAKGANNPKEVVFAKQWKKDNSHDKYNPLIKSLIPDCTQRDATVASTIIQWLGSSVGTCFLCDVINESPELQRDIVDRCSENLKRKKV